MYVSSILSVWTQQLNTPNVSDGDAYVGTCMLVHMPKADILVPIASRYRPLKTAKDKLTPTSYRLSPLKSDDVPHHRPGCQEVLRLGRYMQRLLKLHTKHLRTISLANIRGYVDV